MQQPVLPGELLDLHRLGRENLFQALQAPYSHAFVHYRADVELVAGPGAFHELHPVRGAAGREPFPAAGVEDHDGGTAVLRVFGSTQAGAVRGRVVEARAGGEIPVFAVGTHIPYHGRRLECPARVTAVFAPPDAPALGVVTQAGCGGRERTDAGYVALPVYLHQGVGVRHAAADGIERAVGIDRSGVGREVLFRRRKLAGGGVRGAAVGLGAPDASQRVRDGREGAAEVLSADAPDGLLEGIYAPAVVVVDVLVEACAEVGRVIECAHSGHGDVAHAVLVRGEEPVGAEAPAPVVAEVALVEARPDVFQEIRRAPASAAGKGRLGRHRVALEEGGTAVDRRHRARGEFSEQEVEGAEAGVAPELHLGDVPAFVDGEFLVGVQRGRVVGIIDGEDFQPAGDPGDHSVVVAGAGVHHHGHLPAVELVGNEAYGAAHRDPRLLQPGGHHPCQGVGAGGIDHFVVRGLHAVPFQAAGIGAHAVELRPQRKRRREKRCGDGHKSRETVHNHYKSNDFWLTLPL